MAPSGNVLNFANEKICVREAPGKGRGIFAQQKICKDELVIVEKALAYAEAPDDVSVMSFNKYEQSDKTAIDNAAHV